MSTHCQQPGLLLTDTIAMSTSISIINIHFPRLDRATTDFKKHTAIVVDMKKDLDSIFRRIRNIKVSL